MNEYIDANRRNWDDRVPIHLASDFYDVPSFKAGRSSLLPIERRELGDVNATSLLHLQCHFGMDTLSWAREGAVVTGVDFSAPAIEAARSLAHELQLDARFIETDVHKLPDLLSGSFDAVFASYGVLCWLPDLPAWFRIAAAANAETRRRVLRVAGESSAATVHVFTAGPHAGGARSRATKPALLVGQACDQSG